MKIHHIGHCIKGFYRVARIGYRGQMNPQAQHRITILRFWQTHGTAAACEAFSVSRRTLYRWRQTLKAHADNPEALTPRSTAPKRRRRPTWPSALVAEVRRWRRQHPNLGKLPLSVLLLPWCQSHGIPPPSVSTIGRIIQFAPDKMRHAPLRLNARGQRKPVRQRYKTRRPKGYTSAPMELFACDTVERVRDGIRRYIFTFIDPCSRFAFAWASTTRSSRRAAAAIRALDDLTPVPIRYVLSDNGSEFMKDFEAELQRRHITHWWTYPKSPKMNAHCERFNRTLQESFVDFHEDLLFTDLGAFNRAMADWLVFYHTQRPHQALALQSPIQALINNQPECHMLWTYTRPCYFFANRVDSRTLCGRKYSS